ncbi:MAG TPA: nitroreductase family deazaflavin-dependent oxidoreductase, partial [Nakamurella sp.]|nr:nitroreductase family deazaflavin-dependent oxidoreductase [Nakamurella sp.]
HMKRVKTLYLRAMKNTLNRITTRVARRGRGPFSLISHVGRRSGRSYQTPVVLARVPDGFVAELTYGPSVDWLRNIVAAGGCTVLYRGREYTVDRIDPCSTEDGLRAYGNPLAVMLRLLRREFRRLHVVDDAG